MGLNWGFYALCVVMDALSTVQEAAVEIHAQKTLRETLTSTGFSMWAKIINADLFKEVME